MSNLTSPRSHRQDSSSQPQGSSLLRRTLRQQLLSLPFDAYAQLMARLLHLLGYQGVQLAGRTDWKGRNHSGGCDLVATLPGGVAPRRVVIQLKQFDLDRRIFQRHLDELCGVALRHQAGEAVLITTGELSPSIQQESSPYLPVRLIAGDTVLDYLIEHHLGVTARGTLDRDLFDRLRWSAKGNSRATSSNSRTAHKEQRVGTTSAGVMLQIELHTGRRSKKTTLSCH